MTKQRKILLGFTLLYAAMMIYLLFFRAPAFTDEPYREQLHDHLNHIPFRTIGLYLRLFRPPCRSWLVRLAVVNLLGNILLFIPLGLLPPLLSWKLRRFWKTLLLAAGIMAVVEIAQMLLLVGTCDVDDLILNVCGAALGYWLFYLTHRRTPLSSNPPSEMNPAKGTKNEIQAENR